LKTLMMMKIKIFKITKTKLMTMMTVVSLLRMRLSAKC